ncbi:uncharacterized protein LOC127874568 [Dreissena polymorpha]|uniref:uncharacterized protein LOC127874568 n=1 Tax=Dreissena polymorpha TaxID=45954 RepID=UPI002263E94F|nr:uncharacterized protein LOC127874568 [Dreissena polymorpha]
MRSWSRNKMEDRKLAMKTTEVDRHAAERRKSFHYETRLVNKDLEENIIKTTPRVEEYLDRNQNRYNVWREQERVKLDRKYRSMYRDYLTEYAQLHLQDYEALERDRIRRKQTLPRKTLMCINRK